MRFWTVLSKAELSLRKGRVFSVGTRIYVGRQWCDVLRGPTDSDERGLPGTVDDTASPPTESQQRQARGDAVMEDVLLKNLEGELVGFIETPNKLAPVRQLKGVGGERAVDVLGGGSVAEVDLDLGGRLALFVESRHRRECGSS